MPVLPSTPARDVALPTLNVTPSMIKQSSLVHNEECSIDAARSAVCEDIGHLVPQVPYTFFQENVFPPLDPLIDIAKVIETLESKGVINKDTGRWKDFSKNPEDEVPAPQESQEANRRAEEAGENRVFGKLAGIFSSIIAHSGVQSASTLEYMSRPNGVPMSVYHGKGSKPDGYFVFKDRVVNPLTQYRNRVYWRDLCTPAEFKLRNKAKTVRNDNKKICWNMYQILHEDPRRRFVFAFTIQNTSMRVWLGTRAEVIVSEPFNFIMEKEKLAHFVLSHAYATEQQLGIDTTMRVVKELFNKQTGRLVYDMTVRVSETETRVFRTKGLINDDGTGFLCGRGTRIWDVNEVVDGVEDDQRSGVLKDSWIDGDRMREGDILDRIGAMQGNDKDIFEDTFLTVVCHGDVFIDGTLDNTRGLSTGGVAPPQGSTFDLSPSEPADECSPDAEAQDKTELQDEEPAIDLSKIMKKVVKYYPKSHYRIVFLQRCTPLSKVTSLKAIFGHLADVAVGLQVLHEAETPSVHRDLSAANILVDCEDNVKIADLEYAKELHDYSFHDVKTGTPYFMAVEVDRGVYIFGPAQDPILPSTMPIDTKQATKDAFRVLKAARKAGNTIVPIATGKAVDGAPPSSGSRLTQVHVFRYNTLHDFESLLWIAIYFVSNTERKLASDPADTSLAPTKDDREIAAKLFYHVDARSFAMRQTDGIIEKALTSLPTPMTKIGKILMDLKATLVDYYRTAEKNPSLIGKDASTGLHGKFFIDFNRIRAELNSIGDVVVVPFKIPIQPSKQANRRAITTASKRHAADELASSSKRQKSS